MEKEQSIMNENEILQSNRIAYESPICEIINMENEGSILTGSIDDLPIKEW